MPNFAGLPSGTAAITPQNEPLLRSAYEARTEKELPVLVRACVRACHTGGRTDGRDSSRLVYLAIFLLTTPPP